MTIVVLAEKPSVARDIASVLGANKKHEGYFDGNGFAVTYAIGHLVSFSEPEEMNPAWARPWRIDQLPMIPIQWKYRVDSKTSSQFAIVKKLFLDRATDKIICATDAGREGEHIFRLIYSLTGSNKPVERLWISSLTQESIREGFRKLRPLKDYDNLARAASARARADWIVGLNFTRAYTILNNQLCTVGRVQTPTLALIVDRQAEIDNFKPTDFFEILVTFQPGFLARYIADSKEGTTRLYDKTAAQAVIRDIAPERSGTVVSVTTAQKKTKPRALFDLLALQREANRCFGYTAQETLDIAQSLYEQYKAISYPRTESRYMSSDMVGELPGILSAVLSASSQSVRALFQRQGLSAGNLTADQLKARLGNGYVNDAKLTDHHAIIPTGNIPGGLPARQSNVYNLIVMRFLAIFLPAEVREETTATIAIRKHLFRARGVVIKDPGWTALHEKSEPNKEEDSDDFLQELPQLAKDQQVKKTKEELKAGKTSPPKPYDDASLLTAMKSAGKTLDDEDLAGYMEQSGLGTPATRAATIERLIQSQYIERQKKAILPTAKGKALVSSVHKDLKDVALTANWEQRLSHILDGKLDMRTFEHDICSFVHAVLPAVKQMGASLPANTEGGLGACPRCKNGVVRMTPKGAGCSRWKEGCTFTIWRELYGKKLTDTHILDLVKKGRTKLIKGFKRKDGSGTHDAHLSVGDDFKIRPEFKTAKAAEVAGMAKCPQCRKGTIQATTKAASCSRWQEGCAFAVWRIQYGKELKDAQIKELIEKRRTKPIQGFQRRDGSGTYDARLILSDDFKIRLQFDNS